MGDADVPLGNEEDGYAESVTESHSSASWSTVSPHYDAGKDVIVRMEFLSEAQMKVVVLSLWGAVMAGVGLLIMALIFKLDKEQEYFLRDNTVPKVNLGFACVLLAGLLATCGAFVLRVHRANKTGKRWSIRRKKGVMVAGIEMSLQLLNLLFFLVPNAYVLARDCAWFSSVVIWSAFVRWTCWNSIFTLFWVQVHNSHPAKGRWAKYVGRPDGALMDAPWVVHWPKALIWGAFEAVLLALTLYLELRTWDVVVPPGTETDCTQWGYDCSFTGPALGLTIATFVIIVLYGVGLVYLFHRSFKALRDVPYKEFRIANFMVRLQVRLRVLAFMFFILSCIVFFFVRINTCSSFITSWMGYLPMQFVMTCLAAINAFIFMPKKPGEVGILQVWLQEFAWTEKDVPRKLAERASSLPPVCINRDELAKEPMFCFETNIKMLYWSFLVYDLEEAEDSPFNCDAALSLYDLEHFELFWEKTLDTKAIVGWNNNTVVISFRGTASLANVKADIQAWLTTYPKGHGTCMLCTAPMVHTGFYQAWTANAFNDKLIGRLEHILYRCTNKLAEGPGGEVNVYVTVRICRHSLGGALATLCAFDIVNRCPCLEWSVNMHVYTYGVPRTGNHAFARLYNEKLPNTWNVINNADAVTRSGKFVKLYKRPGHRVLINRRGDLVVRPSFVESSIRTGPGAGSIRDHLLTSYQRAMTAVVAAQFGRKSFQDGKDGVLSLAEGKGTRIALAVAGLGEDTLQELQDLGEEAVKKLAGQVHVKKRARKKKGARSGSGSGISTMSSLDGHASSELGSEMTGEEPEVDSLEASKAGAAGKAGGAPVHEQPAAEQHDGIMHKKGRRTCQGRTCHTVCSLMRPLRGGGAKKGGCTGPSPMCDAPDYSHKGEPWKEEGAGKVTMGGKLEVLVDTPPSDPASPHTPPTNTRGSMSDVRDFGLIMVSPGATLAPGIAAQAILEEDLKEGSSDGKGGVQGDGQPGCGAEQAPAEHTTPPQVVHMQPHRG